MFLCCSGIPNLLALHDRVTGTSILNPKQLFYFVVCVCTTEGWVLARFVCFRFIRSDIFNRPHPHDWATGALVVPTQGCYTTAVFTLLTCANGCTAAEQDVNDSFVLFFRRKNGHWLLFVFVLAIYPYMVGRSILEARFVVRIS